jgi:hypothetical protein
MFTLLGEHPREKQFLFLSVVFRHTAEKQLTKEEKYLAAAGYALPFV